MKYERLAKDVGGNLTSYASGDGSISFSWEDQHRHYINLKVTPEHIKLWRNQYHRFLNLEILDLPQGACLYNPVKRLDEQTLVMENEVYTYKEDSAFTAEKRYLVYDKEEDAPYHVGSSKALTLNFWLRYEKEIKGE